MDIMLERMLSLIPKKENGKYVHGAKNEFCEAIGAPTNIVSEWEAGKTKSYRKGRTKVACATHLCRIYDANKTTPDRITPAGGFCTVTISYICYSFIICSFAAVCRARA